MTRVYFHCSNTKKVFVDYRGAVVDDLAEGAIARPASCNPLPASVTSKTGVTGFCMPATIRAMSSSLCRSLSCWGSRIEVVMLRVRSLAAALGRYVIGTTRCSKFIATAYGGSGVKCTKPAQRLAKHGDHLSTAN